MRKKYILLIIAIVLIILLVFAYMYINQLWIFDKFRNVDVDVKKLSNSLISEFDFSNAYIMPKEEAKEKYEKIDFSKIEEFSVITSFMDIEAFEIGIFKVNEKTYLDALSDAIIERAENIKDYYENYMYTQKEVANEYEIKKYNDTIIVIIHNNKDAVIKYIEKYILE
ncbi:MAG: DUF4358 domain-containing protein [Clostridia bacterium]|nr:DUF4358 domain-containing protein [Clostridia bacterium]